jgi:mitochondrial enoyl-[acyl-carrier protein] reductase / trans-2-enoyl-CoA reductase
MLARALQLQSFGPVETSLFLKTLEVPKPGKGQVLLQIVAAPIHPADLNIIEGKYGLLPSLPALIGNEGVGKVISCGEGVTSLQPGDLVLPGVRGGMWTEARLVDAEHCILLPRELDIFQAAQISINPPTAYWMLTSILPLSPGDWVIQNAANSTVGRCVIQIASRLGLKTLNIVRRSDLKEELRALGADIVLTEEELVKKEDFRETDRPRLALNAIGGASALALANTLASGGIHVTYGAMGRQPLKIPNGLLIFKGLTFRGFWLTPYQTSLTTDQKRQLFKQLTEWVREGSLYLPVEKTYPLPDFLAAIAHAKREKRAGKILFSG